MIGLGVTTGAMGTSYNDEFSLPGTDSAKTLALLEENMPAQSGESGTIVWHVTSGSVKDADVQKRMTAALDKVAELPHVASITGPYGKDGAGQISKDGLTAYAQLNFDAQGNDIPVSDVKKVIETAQEARTESLQVELGGNVIGQAEQPPPNTAELIGIAVAAVVLFIAFGSVWAMLMPLLTAVVALGAGLMSIGLLTHVFTIGQIGPILGALIGLGVGIDYALFIVTRHRKNLLAGRPVEESIIGALNTSGRAVLFAGGTVVIALLGLFVLRMSFLSGMAIASITTVAITVFASLTLLPAMLGFVGLRVLSRKERRALASGAAVVEKDGVFHRWAGFAQRNPRVLSAVSIVLIGVLSVPVLSIRLGSGDAGNSPTSTTVRQSYDLLSEGFGPGFNGPFLLVAETPSDADRTALSRFTDTIRKTPGVAQAVAFPQADGAKVGIVQVIPTTSPQSEETATLIRTLRDDVIPVAERGTTMQLHVGGTTAIFDDFAKVLTSKMPLFIAVIVGLGFLLLLLAFRSLLIPLTAAVMNLLSALASFGLVVAFFQWGWGSEAFGLGAAGPVEAFLPVIMISILFGLSMDYQVFLVSRMHEEWVHTRDNTRAVIVGQAQTGRVITAAATIMIAVFGAFVLAGGERAVAMFGIGLASAVAIDAFILRTMLVPALMHLFGNANWWLPSWLDRILPHLSVEPMDEPVEPKKEPALV